MRRLPFLSVGEDVVVGERGGDVVLDVVYADLVVGHAPAEASKRTLRISEVHRRLGAKLRPQLQLDGALRGRKESRRARDLVQFHYGIGRAGVANDIVLGQHA